MVARRITLVAAVLGVWSAGGDGADTVSAHVESVSADTVRVARDGPTVLVDGIPFTGRLVETDGGYRIETDMVAGRRHGARRVWTPAGVRVENRTYRDGRRDGLHRTWYASGALRTEQTFDADRLDGPSLAWDANGQLLRHSHYADGHESGRQRMWSSDGTLRANYVVADGRRYGLLGTKPCTTS
ncbi:MAG: hypothetical protein AAGK21_00395 [Bacteroidota bacterium]